MLLALLAFCWGTGWPVNKAILQTMPPIWLTAVRSAIATVALFAIVGASGRLVLPRRGDWPVFATMTALHMIAFALLVSYGLTLVPTGRSVVLGYTTPLWAIPAGVLFLGERLTARRLGGAALGLGGLALLFNPLGFDWGDRGAVLGNGLLLLAALLWATSIVHIRGHRWVGSPYELVPWGMGIAALVLGAVAWTVEGPLTVEWTPRLAGLLLYGGIPATAVTFWASTTASRHLPAASMSLGLLGVPPVSILVATLWLGEPLSLALLLAVALILAGIALGTREPAPAAPAGTLEPAPAAPAGTLEPAPAAPAPPASTTGRDRR